MIFDKPHVCYLGDLRCGYIQVRTKWIDLSNIVIGMVCIDDYPSSSETLSFLFKALFMLSLGMFAVLVLF